MTMVSHISDAFVKWCVVLFVLEYRLSTILGWHSAATAAESLVLPP